MALNHKYASGKDNQASTNEAGVTLLSDPSRARGNHPCSVPNKSNRSYSTYDTSPSGPEANLHPKNPKTGSGTSHQHILLTTHQDVSGPSISGRCGDAASFDMEG